MKHKGFFCILALAALFSAARAEDTNALYVSRASGMPYAAYVQTVPKAFVGERVTLYSSQGARISYGESLTFRVSVPQDMFAYPVLSYTLEGDDILDTILRLTVDGVTPYDECGALKIDTRWLSDGTFPTDRYGNQVTDMPEKSSAVTQCRLKGKAGLYSKGMGLFLTAGTHEMTLTCTQGAMTLYGMTMEGELTYRAQTQAEPAKALITLEAESLAERSNISVRPAASTDTALTPVCHDTLVMNCIEEATYRKAGDSITYAFTVEQAGLFALTLRCRQSELESFKVYRTVYIDGAIPSPAFDTAAFDARQEYGNVTIANDDGTPAMFYLDKGKHTLTLEATVDPVRPALNLMTQVSNEMAALALDITKVTGGNTDAYRDFSLAQYGFTIEQDLNDWADELTLVRDELLALSGRTVCAGALSSLQLAIDKLRTLALKPDDLPKKLGQFSQGTSSARLAIVNVIDALSASPLGLDCLYLCADLSLLPQETSFISRAGVTVERFFSSFSAQDYEAQSGESEHLQVWVNRSRQYLEIMQRMADTAFTPQTGITVDFSIMPDESKLVLANASDAAPDVALGVSSGRVYDLAVRGALKDLRAYENFAAVGSWFPEGLLMPGVCGEGLYALPETANFYVLYYRKDILSSIGLAVPNSYEDVLRMLPTLQRYGLNFNNFVSNAIGYKGFAATMPFIYQCGGVQYESGNIKTVLDRPEAVRALKILTDSFLVYDMDYEVVSFYQAFRDGTLPIGTSDYFMYNLLTNAAPELADRWGIAPYPGITDENGTVQRYTSGASQSCIIFDGTELSQEAWTFLSWWMSEKTQTDFAYMLQGTMGNEYLWNSANVEAFKNAPWPEQDKQVIAEQMAWTYDPPRLPGSYMVERELSNIINAVALDGENLRAELDDGVKRIDREMARKLEEFGWLANGELTEPFIVPDIQTVRGWLQ